MGTKRTRFIAALIASAILVASPFIYQKAAATITNTAVQTTSALGNGVTTNYTIGFVFQTNSQLRVYLEDDSSTPHTTTEVQFGAGAGKYTVSGGDPGTTVVMGTAPTSSQRVVIRRVTPVTQTVDYVETEAFPADDHEEAMDKMTQAIQEFGASTMQALRLSSTSSATTPTFPDPAAYGLLGYNSGATDLTLYGLSPATGDVLRFNSSTWALYDLDSQLTALQASIAAHIADTSNPHNVTASQVGNSTAQWNANKIQGTTVDASAIADGRVLTYQSSSGTIIYSPAPLSPSLTNAHIFVGNSSNAATDTAVSGDITISNTGVTTIGAGKISDSNVNASAAIAFSKLASLTSGSVLLGNGSNVATATALSGDVTVNSSGVTAIGANKVTNSQLATIATATFKGRTTAGTGNVEDLTATQATALLNNMVGDSGSGGTKGLVPAPGSGDAAAGKFLKADGNWTVPAGGGTVTSVAAPVVPTGFTSSVANGTTTPAITIATNGSLKSVINVGLTGTVSSSTLVVALKQSDASSDCSAGSPCVAYFRDSTATSGGYSPHSFTAASSITLGTTDSIGTVNGVAFDLYIYLVVDTTSELCLSRSWFDESKLQSASALTGGADTTSTTLWCTNAHTSRPIRLIGKVTGAVWSNPNWAAPTNISLMPADNGCTHRNGQVDRCFEDANGTCSASASITSTGSWVSTGNVGGGGAPTGGCLLTVVSGTFSGTPNCTISANNNITGAFSVTITPSSSTAMTTDCFTSSDCSSYPYELICVGPR